MTGGFGRFRVARKAEAGAVAAEPVFEAVLPLALRLTGAPFSSAGWPLLPPAWFERL
jgi:hypothetical protein